MIDSTMPSDQAPTPAPLSVEQMRAEHWPAVEWIYAEGLATGNASFETETPSWEEFQSGHLPGHLLVALDAGAVVGWAVLSPVSDRCAYQGVAEDSVYVAEPARGRGVGRALLTQLTWRAESAGIWTLQAGIFPENTASIALHHACGFRTVGRRERLGRREGIWRDVLLLERRGSIE
jgi:phosphinothricin acetyltransferase